MDPTKRELYTAKRASGVDMSDPEIVSLWLELRNLNPSCNWFLLHLSGPTKVGVKSQGSGGIEELVAALSDDDVVFGAFRAQIGDHKKSFHLYFVGDNVGGMKRGKASMVSLKFISSSITLRH